jgi:hypothetical protein
LLIIVQLKVVVLDSASNNDTQVTSLQRILHGGSFKGPKNRVRCFAHIINLVSKSILRPFKAGGGSDDFEDIMDPDGYIGDESIEFDDDDDNLNNVDETEDLDDESLEERLNRESLTDEAAPIAIAISKVSLSTTF